MSEAATLASKQSDTISKEPSAELAALDEEIKTRFAKRTGSLDAFLQEWVKLDESQDKLFNSKGLNGENYLEFKLAVGDTKLALPLAKMCSWFAETTSAEKVVDFLNCVDTNGNDVWHYLAAGLARQENEEGLEIAKILINLEMTYIKKNDEDETALSKLLVPEVKWRSINSMNQAKEITLDELEAAFSDSINLNRALLEEIVYGVFVSDLQENEGQFTQIVLAQALKPEVPDEMREKTLRLFFEYTGGKKRENVFMTIAEMAHAKIFEAVLDLLSKVAEAATREAQARDGQLAKAEQQRFYYQRLGRRNRANQNALAKAVHTNQHQNLARILGHFQNENLVLVSKDAQGRTVTQPCIIDETSAAQQNPRMALMLQQDSRGNTVFHLAALASRVECLRKLMLGLSPMDAYMIVSKIPNKFGLTVADSLAPERAKQKLSIGLKKGQIPVQMAQSLYATITKVEKDTKELLTETISRSEDMIRRTGGMSEAKPTFDLRRIPTVALLRMERAAAG